MLINKITDGFVIQVFDTETGKFVSQTFTCADGCNYEDQAGNTVESSLLEVDGKEVYLPFDMKQPEDMPEDKDTVELEG